LHNIINDAISEALSNIKNSFDLIEKLKDINFGSDSLLVSFDVIFLFINVPIDLIVRLRNRILYLREQKFR